MTTFLRKFSVLFAAFAVFAAGSQAFAQRGANILFLDQQRVVSESKAGQSIDNQLQTLTQQVAAEIQQQSAAIEQEGQALQASQESLSKEDFGKRYQVLLQKAQAVEQLKQIRQAELNQARSKAISDLRDQWEPISESVFNKRKGFVLLEKQAVLVASEKGDITDEVIQQLDRAVQTIQVVKPDLVAQAQQAQAQQAAAFEAQQQNN